MLVADPIVQILIEAAARGRELRRQREVQQAAQQDAEPEAEPQNAEVELSHDERE